MSGASACDMACNADGQWGFARMRLGRSELPCESRTCPGVSKAVATVLLAGLSVPTYIYIHIPARTLMDAASGRCSFALPGWGGPNTEIPRRVPTPALERPI